LTVSHPHLLSTELHLLHTFLLIILTKENRLITQNKKASREAFYGSIIFPVDDLSL
jgi:hypothetical protein